MKKLSGIITAFVLTLSFGTCVNAIEDSDLQSVEVMNSQGYSESAAVEKNISLKTPETGYFKTSKIIFDNKEIEFSTVNYKDRVYVKLRDLCYYLKCNIEVDNEKRVINIVNKPEVPQQNTYDEMEKVTESLKVNINISNFIINKDGINTFMNSILYKGRTYVPVRFFSEIFDKKVEWLPDTKSVRVSTQTPVVIGSVNGQALFQKDLDYILNPWYTSFKENNGEEPSESEIQEVKKSSFDTIVAYAVLLQKAEKENITLDQKDYQQINETMESYIMMNGGIDSFRSILEKNKITLYQYSDGMKKDILINKMANELVKDVEPSEEKIKKYYEDNKNMFTVSEKVRAKHILFSTMDLNTGVEYDDQKKSQIRKKAEDVLVAIKSGADFDQLMNENTEDPGTKSYPDGYTFSRGEMVKPFEDQAFSMSVGQVSNIVETSYGYHIIKLEEKIPQKLYTLDEVRDNIKADLSNEEKQIYFDNFVKESIAKSLIENNIK